MATTDKNYLVAIHNGLDEALDRNVAALASDFNKPRFMQNCMAVLQDGRTDFSKCNPNSVVRTLLKGAFLSLDFFAGECYAIPYSGMVQFQTDYKGEVKLAKKYSVKPIKDIYAKLVREGDEFAEEIINGEQTVTFRPKPFNDGAIIGTFAVVLYKDGSMTYETMSIADVESVRKNYSAANSPAWKNAYGEMVKKTVLKRLCKLITLDFDTAEAAQAYIKADRAPEEDISEEVEDETGSEVIDVPYSEVGEDGDEPKEGQMELGEEPF